MKRFVTYLYEYENGQKNKNTGFIRVDERNGKVVLQISLRNLIHFQSKGKVYIFVWKNGLLGAEVASVAGTNAQADIRVETGEANICDTGYSLENIVGMGIVFENGGYVASCWNDNYMERIGKKEFRIWEKDEREKEVSGEQTEAGIKKEERIENIKEVVRIAENTEIGMKKKLDEAEWIDELESPLEAASQELVSYQKMELHAIRNLPSPNWYLCNNRFLVHGFYNYGYIILKKEMEGSVEKAYLGVPGVYEKPEMVMALLFGFPEFQALPKDVQAAQMETVVTTPKSIKTTEPKSGELGCWLIPVQF